jgi:hypothetical protein
MQLAVQLTKSDYSKFRRFARFRLRKTWLVYIPFAALVAWTAFPKDYSERSVPLALAFGVALLVGVVISVLIFLLSIVVVAILPNRPGTVLGEHTFTLTEAELREANAIGSTAVKLEALHRYETTRHVFLLTRTHLGYILPMRDLQNNPEFLRTLRERTSDA